MDSYLLTEDQTRLWLEYKRTPGSHAYNTSMQFKIAGKLDVERFRRALIESINYFDSFRTYFVEKSGIAYQLLSAEKINIDVIELSGNNIDSDIEAGNILTQYLREPFNLTAFPLLKLVLIKAEDNLHYFGFYTPHILLDANSASRFLEFISAHYNHDKETLERFWNNRSSLEDYHSESYKSDFNVAEIEEYWKSHLNGHNLNFNLNTGTLAVSNISGERIHFQISRDTYSALKKITSENRSTLFSVLLGLFNVTLYRFYLTQEIVTSYPVSTRPTNLKNFFGFFVNNTAIKLDIKGNENFSSLIKQIDTMRRESKKFISYPFNKVISGLRKSGVQFSQNLLNISVGQTNFSLSKLQLDDLKIESLPLNFANVNNDLTLLYDSESTGDSFDMAIEYRFEAISREVVKSIIESFCNLISEIARNPEKPIDSLRIVEDQYNIHNNANEEEFFGKTIYSLFEEQAQKAPEATAIICEAKSISYKKLHSKVLNIAYSLVKEGAEKGSFIGVYMERSIEMIATLLAIMRTGAAYIPIDINHPSKRISEIYKDSGCRFIVSEKQLLDKLPAECKSIVLSSESNYDILNLSEESYSNFPAYVIYTSGSTGKPKGVVVSHKNACARLFWIQSKINLSQQNNIITHFNTCFDVSVCDIFTPLCFGGISILVGQKDLKDPTSTKRLINEYKVNNIFSVPSLLNVFLDQIKAGECESLRNVFAGGEKLTSTLQEKFYSYFNYNNTKLYNVYGPTECTILSTCFDCEPGVELSGNTIPIGKPISNTDIYILNNSLQIQPPYAIGEIYIGGASVALGYLNNQELTEKSFIDNPFCRGEKIYKTGDLARYVEGGNIEFIRRIDTQVKIRGFRIEIGEIENVIMQTAMVEQVAVIVSESNKLVAYYKPKENIQHINIKNSIAQLLPEYMVPSYFIALEYIPLNSSGKLDAKNLPKVDYIADTEKRNIILPRNQTDIILRNIWAQVLNKNPESISITDKFFDIGGDSLMTVGLSLQIEQQLEIEFIVNNIFSLPTIEACSDFISSNTQNNKILLSDYSEKKRAANNYRKVRQKQAALVLQNN